MPISIEGKKIIVTGGARGIASDAVRHFGQEGAAVFVFDVLEDLGQQVAEETTAAGPGTAAFRRVDVSKEDEVRDAVDFAAREMGGLDAVFNIAAVTAVTMAEDMTDALWDRLLDVNLKGLSHVCQAAFPHLKERGGSIVNFGSDVGLMDRPATNIAYGATKGAIISYTRLLANGWGQYNIRANVVNPLIRTPMYDEFLADLSAEQRRAYEDGLKEAVPLGGTMGDGPTDLAPVLAFLASDASKFITSQIIGVNGGLNPAR